ncbi:MAG TPA: HlyD family secretion protein [Bryobacteraceae bacterium]|jgi:membrane fusion protein (multidrug efflux system)|nr:HlyD family secretion protein [Bryobacteraceae bacterium]
MANLVDDLSKPEIAPTPTRALGRRSSLKAVAFLVLLIAVGVGVWAYVHFQGRESSDDANVDGHISPIAPKVAGSVAEVLVVENQPVKAGQVLVRIDPRDFQAKVEMNKAAVMLAESQLRSAEAVVPWTNETTRSGASAASADLAGMEAEVERARIAYEQASGSDLAYGKANVGAKQANYERAQADLTRMKPLADKAEISRQQYDAYVAAARVAESELQASQEKLASAEKEAAIRKAVLDAALSRVSQGRAQVETSVANRKQVDIREADVGGSSASVAVARANLEAAELQLSYTTIVAPVAGVVTHKSVEPGQIVSPGQGLMTIIPLADLWVTANFKETQLANVHPGQRAEIKVDMYGRSVAGHVDSISGSTGGKMSLLPPENATGNFVKVVQRIPVKILVDRQDGLVLRPGMNVDVTIFTR